MSKETLQMPQESPRLSRRQFSAATAAAAVTATAATRITPGAAQEATPAGAATPVAPQVQIEVLATGLQDPRYLAVDETGVYFTEAGVGGDTQVMETPAPGTPAASEAISMFGYSGKLSRLDADGTVTVVADGFSSYTFGANGEIVGPAGIALDGSGKAYIVTGAPGPFVSHIELTGDENALFEIDLASGESRRIAELSTYEIEVNPDPATIDSNLYGVAVHEGIAYIADAGGNDILAVDIASGEISTFAVPGGFDAPFLPETGNPNRGGDLAIDSVPSSIKVGPDGRLHVTFVTGGPFPVGFSPMEAYTLDGEKETYATGLTMVTDLAFSSDGTAYAVIMSSDFINNGPGKVVRVAPDGAHLVVVDNLQLPNGIAFDADDTMYLTHKVSFGLPGGGELLRITGATTATGTLLTPPAECIVVDATPVVEAPVEIAAIHVTMGDMYYEPASLTLPADTDVVITLDNTGFMLHDLFIGGTDFFSGILAGGTSAEMTVNLPAGTYEFWCTQIGHRQAGMRGTIVVE
jgi:uncharacterized cupredoxin-like copper-binding protein